MSGRRGELPWHEIPDEYDVGEEDTLSHAFSLDYLADDLPDYMNEEEELYRLPSSLDPLDELLQEEDNEWAEDT